MNDELDRLIALVEDSLVWRAVARPLVAASAAWQSSLIGQAWRARSTQLSSWPPSHRIRFVAFSIGLAAAVHAAILQVVPPYARPGFPVWWLAFVIGAAMLAAACAEALAAAWGGSATGTLIARILAQLRAENRS